MANSFILFKTYANSHQAELDLNRLKEEDVNAYITDGNMGRFGFLSVAAGGIKLHVTQKELKRARKILSDE